MVKRGRALKIVIALVIIAALIHSFLHIVIFKTSLSLTKTIGLSGFAVGELNSEELESKIRNNSNASFASMIIVGAEWVLLFSLIALSAVKSRLADSVQRAAHVEILKKRTKSDTEIDMLYDLLQKNKKITVSKAAELFKVDKEIIESWGEILENNQLAVVDYPRFGEVEIRLNDEKTH